MWQGSDLSIYWKEEQDKKFSWRNYTPLEVESSTLNRYYYSLFKSFLPSMIFKLHPSRFFDPNPIDGDLTHALENLTVTGL
jgi:hypothetical protein